MVFRSQTKSQSAAEGGRQEQQVVHTAHDNPFCIFDGLAMEAIRSRQMLSLARRGFGTPGLNCRVAKRQHALEQNGGFVGPGFQKLKM